jgi:hypothetical protein
VLGDGIMHAGGIGVFLLHVMACRQCRQGVGNVFVFVVGHHLPRQNRCIFPWLSGPAKIPPC